MLIIIYNSTIRSLFSYVVKKHNGNFKRLQNPLSISALLANTRK